MSRLVITRGLPGSGKTTYAKRWVSENATRRSRLNRDDLREMLHGGPQGYARELENAVTVAHQAGVRALLMSGKDVICDDMNLSSRQVRDWQKLASEAGAEFEIVDLTNVPVETCVVRDLHRAATGGRHVGENYIWGKYQQFIKGRPYPLPVGQSQAITGEPIPPRQYVADPSQKRAILVDIDGTMALMNGRGPFEWHRVGEDRPNVPVVTLIRMLQHLRELQMEWATDYDLSNHEIIFMSGRDEVCYAETEEWLVKLGFYGFKLFMRPSLPAGVQQPGDEIVKLALFDEHIRDNYDVQFVLDDRDKVVRMWRSIGLTCLQVAPGAF